ncbi:MAG: hypothetical protein ABW221_03385 [Vicinamibacteria bacterium]
MAYVLQFEKAGINVDSSFVHDNEAFHVQWMAENLGPDDAPDFVDRLVVTRRPEGCNGPEEQDEVVVFDSESDADPADLAEPALPARFVGPAMSVRVGPFPVGAYRLTVTLDVGGDRPVTTLSCVDVAPAG